MTVEVAPGVHHRLRIRPGAGRLQLVRRVLFRTAARRFAVAIIVVFALMAIVGPYLYPSPLPVNANLIYAGPSLAHPLGTDFEGTSVFSLLITGARYVLLSATIAGTIAVTIGTAVGLISGYLGGPVDGVLSRITDFALTVPTFPLLVVISTVWQFSSPVAMGLILGVTGWGGLARAVRSQTLSLRQRPYLEAARGLGLSTRHIITTEVLPNVASYVAMNLLIAIIGSIYAETGLFFLGIMPATFNNWGVMLNLAVFSAGAIGSSQALLFLLSPLIAILLLTLAIVLILDAVDELFNPRLRTL